MRNNAATRAVKRGARLLDNVLPGWEKRVEIDRLSIASTCNCVLGQVYRGVAPNERSGYGAAAGDATWRDLSGVNKRTKLGRSLFAMREKLAKKRPRYYGFDADTMNRSGMGSYWYMDLDTEWKREIERRLAKS